MNYMGHSTVSNNRIPELLENLKSEVDNLTHDASIYKAQRDEYELKLQAQLAELNQIQQTLYELQNRHTKIKQQYDEEIIKLRTLQGGESSIGFNWSSSNPNNILSSPSNLAKERQTILPNSFSGFKRKRTDTDTIPGPGSYGQLPSLTGLTNPGKEPPHKITTSMRHSLDDKPLTKKLDLTNHGSPKPISLESNNNNNNSNEINIDIMSNNNNNNNNNNINENKLESKFDIPSISSFSESNDWRVGYNPNVTTNLQVELLYDLDHTSVVCCVKFSKDGKYLATGCNRIAQLFSVETGEIVHTFSDKNAKSSQDLYLRSVCFSPDSKYLACGAEDKTIKLWNIETQTMSHTFTGHEMDIYSLDFSADGRFIVSGSGDKKAKVWDVEKGVCLYTLGNDEIGPKDGITSVSISPDGTLVAAGSLDRIVRLWNAQTGYFLERYEGHQDSVYSVAFSPDGNSLASGSLDKTLKLWDISNRTRSRCRSTFTGHSDFVLSVAFSNDGKWLISGSKDRSVQFWDPKTAVTHMKLEGHKNSVISVSVNPHNGTFATGSGDFKARVWRYKSSN
eukprot:TRINITY_DN2215_c0_g1_i1.p1 TRINITY_DN2215_c0_g1~~TRINITY_DN2215_c0_g1_i1.p1  ORF type:complete len:564 (+),score=178.05 TRINITY_DN2215_c0_g1_i1:157-1848(+)